jgi:hypothetical protein
MAESMENDGIVHGNLKAGNIIVSEEGIPVATGHATGTGRTADGDHLSFAALCGGVFLAACEPEVFRSEGEGMLSLQWFIDNSRHCMVQAEFSKQEPLLELILAMQQRNFTPRRSVIALMKRVAVTPFAPMAILAGLSGRSDEVPAVVTDHGRPSGGVFAKAEDVSLRVDFSRCDHVADVSDTIVRFMERGRWDFADRHGNRITSSRYLSAGDFYEGRAKVETREGWGLIDREGGYVMAPGFELLEWWGEANAVSACAEGRWELYDRQGRQLSAGGFDWMGDCEEGVFVVRRSGKYGYLNSDGTPLTELRFDEAYSFHGGRALVKFRGQDYLYIDTKGEKV